MLLLTTISAALAQVNVESARKTPEEDGVSGSVAVSLGLSTGNVLLVDGGLDARAQGRWNKDTAFVIAQGRMAAKRTAADRADNPQASVWDEEARFANQVLTHGRYNRELSKLLTWEVYAQVEFNQFLMLDLRDLAGTGPRFTLLDNEEQKGLQLWLGTSAMVEHERLDPETIAGPTDSVVVRSSNYLTGKVAGDSSGVTATVYFQPRFDLLADYRILAELSLQVAIGEVLSLTSSFKLRHDSDPPPLQTTAQLEPTDTTMTNGLSLSF